MSFYPNIYHEALCFTKKSDQDQNFSVSLCNFEVKKQLRHFNVSISPIQQ